MKSVVRLFSFLPVPSVVIGSQAGVLPGKIVRPGVWWGTPIQPLEEYERQNAHVKSLERLRQDIKDLKAKWRM